jgi:16S rRNA (cytosine1402-N4)-methyltransferase
MSNTDYHVPVMLKECINGLAIKPDGIYVDITFGGGGHSRAIMEQLTTGKLLSFDQDEDAKKNTEGFDKEKFTFIQANFRHIRKFLRVYGVKKVDGILADLGVSSFQIDTAERGFSTRFDADLDMRMNRKIGPSAKDVINTYSVGDLHKIFGMYGELKNAKTAAQTIDMARSGTTINTVEELKAILEPIAPRFKEFKYFAQVFQALRIEVNEEMKALEEFLFQVPDLLSPSGRLVVMSYHSLEDRMVKNYIKCGHLHGQLEKDFFGNVLKPLKAVSRKPIMASTEELESNPRARSSKLRVAEKPKE